MYKYNIDNYKKSLAVFASFALSPLCLAEDNHQVQPSFEQPASVSQDTPQRRTNILTDEEQQFINKVAQEVQNDNQAIDYRALIKQAPTDNKGIFWYKLAATLSDLPSNDQLDMRENGRLKVSLDILNKLVVINTKFPQIWAQKIIVLNYLAHGHWARGNSLVLTIEAASAPLEFKKSKQYAHELLITTQQAVERFPDDEWFIEQQKIAIEDFTAWVNQ